MPLLFNTILEFLARALNKNETRKKRKRKERKGRNEEREKEQIGNEEVKYLYLHMTILYIENLK